MNMPSTCNDDRVEHAGVASAQCHAKAMQSLTTCPRASVIAPSLDEPCVWTVASSQNDSHDLPAKHLAQWETASLRLVGVHSGHLELTTCAGSGSALSSAIRSARVPCFCPSCLCRLQLHSITWLCTCAQNESQFSVLLFFKHTTTLTYKSHSLSECLQQGVDCY